MVESRPAFLSSPFIFDPASPDYITDPYPILRLIREAEPIHKTKMGWLVTRYEHASTVLRDSRL
jgi:cytochrome P450